MTDVVHICVAMKPLDGNFAQNALKHGVAGINIDEIRVGTKDNLNGGAYTQQGGRESMVGDPREGVSLGMFQPGKTAGVEFTQPSGRFPANVILDGSDEVTEQFPDVKTGSVKPHEQKRKTWKFSSTQVTGSHTGDEGSAARFFKQCESDND